MTIVSDPAVAGQGEPSRAALRPRRRLLFGCALLTLVCAIAFPLAPVVEPVVEYRWTPTGSAPGERTAVLPLMPYQPMSFSASATCAAVRRTSPGALVMATTPESAPEQSLEGLRWRRTVDGVAITSNGVALAVMPIPRGECTLAMTSDPERTTVTLDGTVLAETDRDVRPVVAVLTTSSASTDGLSVVLRTDTRFETAPSVWKWLLGAGCLVGLAGLVAGARGMDEHLARRMRSRGRRRSSVDAAVAGALTLWAGVGPASVDDGYITTILRSRAQNGFVGNTHRWLNAPEAPFGWFYEVERVWAAAAPGLGPSVLWLRAPATVLGLVCWVLLRRRVLPRFGPVTRTRGAVWVAALMFAAWWIPFGLTLRAEPWVATGLIVVWVLTERAIATRGLLPLVLAAITAGLTVAAAPTGLVGVVPLVVALPVLARQGGLDRVLVVAAAGASALLPMTADQSSAAVLESTRIRRLAPGNLPWWSELDRYVLLLRPGELQGAIGPRLPVMLLLVALPAVAFAVHRQARGLARPATRRLLATVVGSLLLLALSPTKWTWHFGALIGLGAAVLTLLVVSWWPSRTRSRRLGPVAVLGGVLTVAVLVLLGYNQWAWVGNAGLYAAGAQPTLGPARAADVVAAGALAIVPVLGVVAAVRGRVPRLLTPSPVVVVLVATVVIVVAGSFVAAAHARGRLFTYGSNNLAALRGDPCGLSRWLRVERDPTAGLLLPASAQPIVAEGFDPVDRRSAPVPLEAAGAQLPGWIARPDRTATLRSPWFALPPDAQEGRAPVVVTAAGPLGEGDAVALEFARGPEADGAVTAVSPGGTAGASSRDLRAVAPPGSGVVRVAAVARGTTPALAAASTSATPDVPFGISVPRVPRTVPFGDLAGAGSPVLADWPIAAPFGCLRPPALAGGTAETPVLRLSPPGGSTIGDIAVTAVTGGPFVTAYMSVRERRLFVYLDGEPLIEPVGLVRWEPTTATIGLRPQISSETRSGWASTGRVNRFGTEP